MAEVKWIKIVTDVFDNRKIRQIEKMPEGDAIVVIWFKLLCLAGSVNDCGMVYLTKEVPYTTEMLSIHFGRPLNIVNMALNVFESLKMIEIVENVVCVSNWEKYQNIDGLERIREQNRIRKQRQRSKEIPEKVCHVTVTPNVTQCHATDIDIDKDNNSGTSPRTQSKIPKLDEVEAYCRERGNGVDAQRWYDFYQSKGWMIGKNKMKDWKAAVRTWEKKDSMDGEIERYGRL